MNRLSRTILIGLLALLVPATAAAHEGMGPWLEIPEHESLRQGQPFTIRGDDLDPADLVTIELHADGEVLPLGTVTTDGDGHFVAEMTLPAELADGDAYVQVTTRAGWAASMWVHVGEEPAAVPPPPAALPAPPSAGAAWSDPSVIVLVLLVGGAGLALMSALLRRGGRRPRRA